MGSGWGLVCFVGDCDIFDITESQIELRKTTAHGQNRVYHFHRRPDRRTAPTSTNPPEEKETEK